MYCPKCGDQNGDEIKFCRSCGTNIGLVSQALTGQLAINGSAKQDEETLRKRQQSFVSGVKKVIIGMGFTITGMLLCLFGTVWIGVWFFIPACGLIGKGVENIMNGNSTRAMINTPMTTKSEHTTREFTLVQAEAIPPAVSYMSAPPSVTESTTRKLVYESNK